MSEVITTTVLLTDVVGSTQHRVATGDAVANELMLAIEHATELVVAAHGGTTVKHLGDGTLAIFPSASAALTAASDALALGPVVGRAVSEPVSVCAGVASGDVEVVAGDVHGRPVVTAARLCSAAGPGQVLVDDLVPRLAEGRHTGTTEPIGELDLKGLGLISAHTLKIEPEQRVLSDLPTPPSPVAARSTVLDQLERCWRTMDEPRVVALTGEPGIGKSVLLENFVRDVLDGRGRVVRGACRRAGGGVLQPWAELCEHALGSMSLPELAHVAGFEPERLLRLAPIIGERLALSSAGTDPVDNLDGLARVFAGMVARIASSDPVLLVLDDMQWCTPDSARLLETVIPMLPPTTMTVISYRHEPDHDVPVVQAIAALGGHCSIREFELEPLDRAGLAELLELDVDDPELDVIAERCGGNPAIAQALVRTPGSAGQGLTVRQLVSDRIDSIGPDARHVLTAAAAFGGEVDISALVDVVDPPADLVYDVIESAIQAGVLREGRTSAFFRFSHGMVADGLLEALRGPRRSLLHVRIADALEARNVSPELVAEHLIASGSMSMVDRLLERSLVGARRAAEAFANEDARAILDRAVVAADSLGATETPALMPVLAQLSFAQYQLGDLEGRRSTGLRLHRLAAAADDPEMLREAARAVAGFPTAGRRDHDAERVLHHALEHTPVHRLAARAELMSMIAYYRAINESAGWSVDDLAAEAVELALEADEPFELAETLAARSFVLTGAPAIDEHLDVLSRLETLSPRIENPLDRDRHEQYLLRQRGVVRLRSGDRAGFDEDLGALESIAQARSAWLPAATASMWRGLLALGEGHNSDAEHWYERMLAAGDREPNFVNSYAAALFVIRRSEHRLAELRELAETVVGNAPGLRSFQPALALVRLADGDREAAAEIFGQFTADGLRGVPTDATESFALATLLDLAIEFDERAIAEPLLERLAPYGGQMLVVAWGVAALGAADRFLGQLFNWVGDHERAAAAFAAAHELEVRLGLPALAAVTRAVSEG